MKRLTMTLVAISSILLLAGCGQSGPLYLPGNPNKVEEISPASPNEEERDRDNDDGATR